ncbi:hypothetical protein PTKIN_Ptkin07bG0247600 [Pterospermum kingtungense]
MNNSALGCKNKDDSRNQGRPKQAPPQKPPPLEPPHSSLDHGDNKRSDMMITGKTVVASMLSAALLVAIFCAFVRCYFNRRNHSRRRSLPIYFGTGDDFLNEDQGPSLDNPIWYIDTIGLQQSVIDSITHFKYKKDEGLVEGTECSVCLSEFQDDESLRLLPKCSHAFHLPCIDTWLRSHKNCPLCRAPVVCETVVAAQANASEPNSIDSGSRNQTLVEDLDNYGSGLGRNDVGEGGTSELRTCPVEDGNISENSSKSMVHSKARSSDSHVLIEDDDVQPMRRSVSLDLSSAMEIYSDVGGVQTGAHKHHASLDTTKGKIVGKRGSESSSIYKLMKSSSIGRSLSKGPISISMKRSFSSGGKFLSSKQSRSQDSILPL